MITIKTTDCSSRKNLKTNENERIDQITDSYDQLIRELEETRDQIRNKYKEMESSGEEDWTRLDKNIYTDMESFNSAFKKAGALFKPRQK